MHEMILGVLLFALGVLVSFFVTNKVIARIIHLVSIIYEDGDDLKVIEKLKRLSWLYPPTFI
mgnify:CR=1 FL=1